MTSTEHLVIRPAHAGDDALLDRLAQLDSRRLPAGPHLIAERDGVAIAAISETTREAVADPFTPTADVIAVLGNWADRQHAADAARRDRRRVFGLRAPRLT